MLVCFEALFQTHHFLQLLIQKLDRGLDFTLRGEMQQQARFVFCLFLQRAKNILYCSGILCNNDRFKLS